jgi:RimJ/RimL family protein N-acetyltransferase
LPFTSGVAAATDMRRGPIITKADGRIVGRGGLYDDPFDLGWGVEVGCYFHPSAWGQGYATALVAACTDFADRILALPEVSAFARPQNAGCRRVLEMAGFAVIRFVPQMERFLYRRRRPGIPPTRPDMEWSWNRCACGAFRRGRGRPALRRNPGNLPCEMAAGSPFNEH